MIGSSPLASINWGEIGSGASALFAGLAIVISVRALRFAKAAEEAALAGTTWEVNTLIIPDASDVYEGAVSVTATGANIWVHEVRLAWGPRNAPRAHEIGSAPCPPFHYPVGQAGHPPKPVPTLPMLVYSGAPLELRWPTSVQVPGEEEGCDHWVARILWSVSRKGPKAWRELE